MAETEEICAETQNHVSTQVWDTESVVAAEAFDFYREGICAAFMPLRPELNRQNRAGFMAKVKSHRLREGVLNVVSSSTHTVIKSKREIAASSEDCFYLNLQIAGHCTISQQDHSIVLRTGDVGIFDSASAFELRHDNATSLGVASLMVPKKIFNHFQFNGPQVLSQHPIFGAMLSESLRSLTHAVRFASAPEVQQLHELTLNLVGLSGQDSPQQADEGSKSLAQFFRIKRIVRQNCADPEFGVKKCSKIAGLSVGYVHQVFAKQSGRFGAFLLKERLLLARQCLSDPGRRHLPISSIAFEAGFKDLSHFGRVFRQEYGLPPGAWRQNKFMELGAIYP